MRGGGAATSILFQSEEVGSEGRGGAATSILFQSKEGGSERMGAAKSILFQSEEGVVRGGGSHINPISIFLIFLIFLSACQP